MAPAAQYHETLRTIATTTHSLTAKDTTSIFDWLGTRRAPAADSAPPPIPHSPSSSHDVALRSDSSKTATLTTPIANSLPPPHHSTYPRVSPPGILYPETIVPRTETRYSNPLQEPYLFRHSERPYHQSIMDRVDYALAYLPIGYKVLLVGTLAIIILGLMWTVMTWAVCFRMETTTESGQEEGKKRTRKHWGGEERRPIDKVSKYAAHHGHGRQSETLRVDEETLGSAMDIDSAVTSAAQMPFSYLADNSHGGEAIEMKYRPRRSQNAPSGAQNHTYLATHRRTSGSPSAGPRFNYTSNTTPTPTISVPASPPPSTPTTHPSPINPFLDPPPPPNTLLKPSTSATLVKRSSLEWQAGRAAFFAPRQNTTSTPASGSVSGSVSPALSITDDHGNDASFQLNLSDMEALEAGTAPFAGRQNGYPGSASPSSGASGHRGFGLVRKSKSFIHEGIGLVEDIVDGVAAKLTRWTDNDDGGEEALLLPVARRGRGRGRDVSVSVG